MAILEGDGISGSFGHGVYYRRKGKKILRAKPEHYTDKKSPAQLFNREKMHLASRFIRAVKLFARIGYQDTEVDLYDNYSNEIRQYMMKECFIKEDDNPVLVYEKIKISRGEIWPPEEYSLQFNETPAVPGGVNTVTGTITWKIPSKKEWMNSPLDKVMICMFSDSGIEGLAWLNKNMAERKDGTLTISIPRSDKPIHFWMFFHNADVAEGESKKKISDSVYLGSYLVQQ